MGNFSAQPVYIGLVYTVVIFLAAVSLIAGMAQVPGTPDVDAQRAAMKKLSFLIGKWAGEASVLRGPGQFVDLSQTEEAQFKLDGLVLMIEGVGRTKADGKLALQALGSYFRRWVRNLPDAGF